MRGPFGAAAAWWLLAVFLLGVLVEVPVWIRALRHEYHNFDLGIYAQALHRIGWRDPNPWLSVHSRTIFSDHFDPILLAVAPFAKGAEPAFVGLVAELLFVAGSGLVLLAAVRRGRIGPVLAGAGILYLFFNRGVLSGLLFPIHPTTWAVLPTTLLGVALVAGHRVAVLSSLAFLLCFKEEFAFVGLMVAVLFLLRGDRRFGLLVLGGSLLWIAFAFWLRPLWLGPPPGYAQRALDPLSRDPVRFLWQVLGDVDVGRLLALALPLLPLAVAAARRGQRPRLDLLVLLLPLLGFRLLLDSWKHHYLAPLTPLLLLAVMPWRGRDDADEAPAEVSLGTLGATALLLAACALSPLRDNAVTVAGALGVGPEKPAPARLAAIAEGRAHLLEHREGAALVGGNLLPRLVERPDVHQVAGKHDPDHVFRYVFVEKPPGGAPWPVTHRDIERWIEGWRSSDPSRVLRDDEHVFFAEGRFLDRGRRSARAP